MKNLIVVNLGCHIYCVPTQSLNAAYATCTYLEIRCPQNLIDKAKSLDQF